MTESPIDHHDLDPFEGEVRAMLHRRASAVHPQRPGWESLETPQVRLAYSPHRGLRTVQRRSAYFRPATAVASVLVIVFVGVMVVDRIGSGPSETDETTAASEGGDGSDVWPAPPSGAAHPEIPAPGSVAFDPFLALPLHPVTDEAELAAFSSEDLAELLDPVAVATDYLASVDIEEGSGPVAGLEVDIAEHEDRSRPDPDVIAEVTVAWSTWGEASRSPALTSGFVYLRRSDEVDLGTSDGLEDRPWLVVGARTQDLDVAGVHRDEDTLIFGVSRLEDASGISQLRIDVDYSTLESRLAEGDQDTFTVHAVDDAPVRLQMQHVDSEPLSIFDMTIPALGEGYDALAATEVR